MEHMANRGKPLVATSNAQHVLVAEFYEKTVAKKTLASISPINLAGKLMSRDIHLLAKFGGESVATRPRRVTSSHDINFCDVVVCAKYTLCCVVFCQHDRACVIFLARLCVLLIEPHCALSAPKQDGGVFLFADRRQWMAIGALSGVMVVVVALFFLL